MKVHMQMISFVFNFFSAVTLRLRGVLDFDMCAETYSNKWKTEYRKHTLDVLSGWMSICTGMQACSHMREAKTKHICYTKLSWVNWLKANPD